MTEVFAIELLVINYLFNRHIYKYMHKNKKLHIFAEKL